MSGIDWRGLMQAGLHGLGLRPAEFWGLTPAELRMMLGVEQVAAPLTRARLAELAAAFPDGQRGFADGGNRNDAGTTGGAGGATGQFGGGGGGV